MTIANFHLVNVENRSSKYLDCDYNELREKILAIPSEERGEYLIIDSGNSHFVNVISPEKYMEDYLWDSVSDALKEINEILNASTDRMSKYKSIKRVMDDLEEISISPIKQSMWIDEAPV